MYRLYYVEADGRTSETSSRLEAARIRAEWAQRGYDVSTVAVDVTDDSVEIADCAETSPRPSESVSRGRRGRS